MSNPYFLKPTSRARALETSLVWNSKILLGLNLVLVVAIIVKWPGKRKTLPRWDLSPQPPDLLHSCPILSNRFHPTKQHSICCRSENCISLARSGQSAVDSIDSFDLSNGKVYYRFDKLHLISDNGDPVQDCRIDRFVRLVGMVISFTIPH